MENRFICIIILLLFILSGLSAEGASGKVFSAVGIQFEISDAVYSSENAFFRKVEDGIIEAIESEIQPDLIIFPEYIGVFFQLIEYNEIISRHTAFTDALSEVLEKTPRFDTMTDVFTRSTSVIRYLEGWSKLAEKYKTTIIAGSCFITVEDGDLRNRSFVFDSNGKLFYQQDKVFLTEFETDVIGLMSGSIDDAKLFTVSGRDVALTICRDTYAAQWEKKNSGAFLWVDIKANGEEYNAAQQRSFMRALPQRLIRSDVENGMTVCAVGSYLDLFWEGESTALYKTGDRLALIDISESYNRDDQIIFNIRTEQ